MATTPAIEWTKQWGSNSYLDIVTALAISVDGALYATEFGGSSGNRRDFLTRLKPDGTTIWRQGFSAAEFTGDPVSYLSAGADGAIYVAGTKYGRLSDQGQSSYNPFVMRFNQDGTTAWTVSFGGSASDVATCLTTSTDGAVYLAGTTTGNLDGQTNAGEEDAFIARINPDGTKAWTRSLGGSSKDRATSLTTGPDGAVYVAGVTKSDFDNQVNSSGYDSFITRYNPDGTKAWTKFVSSLTYFENNSSNSLEAFKHISLTTGADGAIYLAGTTFGNLDGEVVSGGSDAFVTRFNTDGTRVWTKLSGIAGADTAAILTTGNDGAIYLAGSKFSGYYIGLEAFLTRYNADGTTAWSKLFGSSGLPQPNSLTAGPDGAIYIGGSVSMYGEPSGNSTSNARDAIIIKLLDTYHAPTGAVTISGTAKQHQTLNANNTLADADGLGMLNYQWKADGVNIEGATNSSFTLTLAEMGKLISVTASYTDGAGYDEQVTSRPMRVAKYNTAALENSKLVITIPAADPLLGTAPKYTLNGTDAWLFKVSSKGVLTFATVKDYEQPVDANQDGIYEVSVTMTNAKTGYRVVQDLTVGVEFVPIIGTAGNDALKGTAGWDTLDGLAGDDKLTGGTGLDTFLVTSGHDTILDFNALTKGATGNEILQVSEGAVVDATLKAAWIATADSFNDGVVNLTTKSMAVDLSGITHGQGWNVTNTGAATQITGSQFNDVLTGGTGNDILLGGIGNDVLAGGKGFDFLTGGTGADTFRLSGDTKTDHITDFLSGTDRIELDNLVFKALLTEGQLAADQFALGTAATTTTQRIVYDQPTGNLWYDVDGSGKKAAVLIGVLDNHVQIAHTDFWVI